MKTKGILILSALLSLFGCTSGVDQWMTTTTTAPRGPLLNMDNPSEAGPEILARIAMRGYLDTSKPVPRGYGAYAYLVFTSDPLSTNKERYLAVCSAFKGYLPPSKSKSARERASEMITFWPLRAGFLAEDPDCQELVANYDTTFAARVAASIGKQGARGPLLVAWTKPHGETRSEALVLDMSNFGNNDVSRAMRMWKDRIAMDPALWQKGWNAALVKEEFRSVIENILPDVVTVVGAWLPKPSK